MRKSIKIFIFLPLILLILTAATTAPEISTTDNPSPILAQDPTPIPIGPNIIQPGTLPCDPSQVHGLYFYSKDCPHCMAVLNDLLLPMQNELGTKLHIRLVEIDYPENYELLIRAEDRFSVKPEERAIPTLIIDGRVLIGEDAIRTNLRDIVEQGILGNGIPWPDIPNFDPSAIISEENAAANAEMCTIDSSDTCETGAPIYAAYFYQTGCDSCSRVEADLAYLRSKYPQLIVEKFNIYDDAGLGLWLADQAGREDFHTPALFIGSETWIGEGEITPEAIETALKCFAQEGSPKVWEAFNEKQGSSNIIDKFRSMSWLTVVFAGLVDGLNPCAFATLIFFISYLTISERKGREVIFVGIAFTVGVFLAYLVIGLGFYKVLDLLGNILNVVARWVYGLTGLLCISLAVFSFMDVAKARKGKLKDMSLNLPEGLRKRINAVIRKGHSTNRYMIGAFVTGIVISMIELACTGQVYLPTIIFVSSMPELRLRAIFYLIIYNLLFILPLIVVFILAYFGTSSKELTRFLQKHAAAVKIGLGILFLALGIWLFLSTIA
ncbi:MAG: cytochrome c biogenesis protein CcdA [Anaerolineaceae bacterium]|nr:cytochrome c biogenesis protein CcdA [Anaerolineaceae bacterium]